VEEGVTGILHQPASEREISEAMNLLASDEKLRKRMGEAAHRRAAEGFSEERLTAAMGDFYGRIFSGTANAT
jgi:glycosyltransferase involved in cell wall biosynthesis